MSQKFHINKHGIPAVCNTPIAMCSYGDEKSHFRTYEDARKYIDQLNEAVNGNITFTSESPAQKIRSYYQSGTAINEFPLNKMISDLIDFDMVIISWLTAREVKEDTKRNMIGEAKFTYGDIVRVLEEELKLNEDYKDGLKLKEKYYSPIPFGHWENQMKEQWGLYQKVEDKLIEELGFESMSVICLPMSARRRLVEDNYLINAENLNEVIYKVVPAISHFGNIVSYNHNSGKMSREYDIHEIAGAVDGKTIHELCYGKGVEGRFDEVWQTSEYKKSNEVSYETAKARYIKQQFFKGLEGTDIPRAFMRMSPIVAKEIAGFVSTHRTIMMAIGDYMNERGVDEEAMASVLTDKDDWVIE